jgi:hypothetical protein
MPQWLPAAVWSCVLQVEKLFCPALPDNPGAVLFAEELAILHRLVTDDRMKYVWRELHPRAKADKDLVAFFDTAWQQARSIARTVETRKDRAARAKPYLQAAELCRWTREHDIAAKMNPELAAAAAVMAGYFAEVERREGNLDSPLIVKYHGEDDVARAYARVLGQRTRELFGATLYRTVATTASVALDREIIWQQIRDWTNS